jgi:predicted GNAT family N-acyltransferase
MTTSEHPLYNIELLTERHNRKSFSCGVEALDNYLQQHAGQEIRKYVATTFILTEKQNLDAIGYYTLASIAVDAGELPESIAKRLPKYPQLPATLLGRLAVAKKYQGQRLGELLIVDALRRSIKSSKEVASMAIIVDAKCDKILNFYKHYGFIQFSSYQNKLFLPMATAAKLFKFEE